MTVHDSRYLYIWVNSMIYTSILSLCNFAAPAIVKGGARLLASVPVGEL